METFILPKGTICHRNGFPFELAEDTPVLAMPANWPLITEEFSQPTGGDEGSVA